MEGVIGVSIIIVAAILVTIRAVFNVRQNTKLFKELLKEMKAIKEILEKN